MHRIRKLTRIATGGFIDLRTDQDIVADYTKRREHEHTPPRRALAHSRSNRRCHN